MDSPGIACRRVAAVIGLLAAGLAVFPRYAAGQQTDSLRHYDLDEIVVRSGADAPPSATIQRIPISKITRENAETVDNIVRLVPGAHIQTNSRGETLVYLRNAGERQVAIFLAGALLNVPWDNRVDLAALPGIAIGSIEVAKGPSSVLFGANVVGGAINLLPRTLDYAGHSTEIAAVGGSEAARHLSASHLSRVGPWQFGAALEHTRRDGFRVPDGADLPFSQSGGTLRTNTDREFSGFYGNVGREIGEKLRVGLTVIHSDGAKGIAPESHVDAATSSVRFWRYPTIKRTYIIANAAAESESTRLSLSTWYSSFTQDVDQFSASDYATVVEEQRDNDDVIGSRVSYQRHIGSSRLLLAANYLRSVHDQENRVSPEIIRATYRQDIFSVGSEFFGDLGERTSFSAGLSVDGYVAPGAADAARNTDTGVSASAGLTRMLDGAWNARVAVGRKIRFPTTRELLDDGLGRFLLNPDLSPEASILAEVALAFEVSDLTFEIIPFVTRTTDTIDQTRILVDGSSFRQRVNLDGSTVAGVEIVGVAKPHPRVAIDFAATATRARGRRGDAETRLVEKPAAIASVGVSARSRSGVSLFVQSRYRGRAWGTEDSGALARLAPALSADVRLGYLVAVGGGVMLDVFGRVDNVFDAVVLPQLGLPEPGRTIRAGITVSR